MAVFLPNLAAAADGSDIDVTVQVDGRQVHTDVSFTVAAQPREAGAVLTDFAHMAQFVSNLSSSHVLSRNGNTVRVAQEGKAGAWPLSFAFHSIRELDLVPYELIRSHMVSGNMEKFEGITQLGREGDKTRVRYHSDAISSRWIPPVVGQHFIVSETREQFAEMRNEILRRKQAGLQQKVGMLALRTGV
jgi:hypothetical protein